MSLFDLILLLILGAFALSGLWFGFFHTLGSLVGLIVGTFVAGLFYQPISIFIAGIFGHPELVRIIVYLVIFIVVARLIGFGFFLLDKSFGIITKLPFIHSIDRLLGGILGFIEGVFVIGIALYILSQYTLSPTVTAMIEESSVAPWFIGVSFILQYLLPKALREAQTQLGI